MSSDPRWHLYHRIADRECAETRSQIAQSSLGAEGQVRFRNVDTGPEALRDLVALASSDRVPLLHDTLKRQIYLGKEAILRYLTTLGPML